MSTAPETPAIRSALRSTTVLVWTARVAGPWGSWCRITLDDTDGIGSVTVDSDHGRWGYNWPARYRGDTPDRRSLARFVSRCDAWYLALKFQAEDDFDAEATVAAIRERLDEVAAEDGFDTIASDCHEIAALYDAADAIGSAGDFEEWLRDTPLDDADEFRRTVPNRAWTTVYATYWAAFRADVLAAAEEPHDAR